MTILFEDGLTTVIHGDWRDHIDRLDVADALVTDPPYGMQYRSNFGATATPLIIGDGDTLERDTLIQAWREHGGESRPALVFGTWRMPRPTDVRELIIWHKRGGWLGDLSLPWGPAHEEIYVLGGAADGSWTGKREANVITTGKRDGNATASHTEHGHPTPKPVLLMQSLIGHIGGDVIIDPFAGSGTTGVAARLMGRRSVLIEVDEGYANSIADRIRKLTSR